MRFILKAKWLVVLIWVVAIAALIITAPNISKLVREKGQADIPEGYSSSTAQHILKEMHEKEGTGNTSSVALVFYDDNGLSKKDISETKKAIKELKDKKSELGITSVTTHFDQPDLKKELVSKNGKTILVSLSIDKKNRQAADVTDALYKAIDNVRVDHYYTSSWMIDEDMATSAQDGLHKTEWITVVFILIVLFFVFRSLVAPLIPLIAVGISFIISQSIVAFFAQAYDFPLSNFTQIFLVAVLFGIGTDYCILLLSRFKEELPKHETVNEAIIATYRHGGRTVFFSGLAVLIGFSTIGLSTFSIYQSAAGVAIGIVILILALVTVVPFLMSILGTKLFWPAKGSLKHKQSRFWDKVGQFALTRSLIALLIVAVIIVPFLFKYNGDLSFNSLSEIGDSYHSVKGFNIIANNFGPGKSMPTKIVIKNDDRMDQRPYLQTIEAITREVKKIDGVDTVRSVTQPTGKPIKDFLVPYQAKTLDEGLTSTTDAVNKIASSLDDAAGELSKSEPQLNQATDGIDDLIDGTSSLKDGIVKLGNGLDQLQAGLEKSNEGAKSLTNGLKSSQAAANALLKESQRLLKGYQEMGKTVTQLNNQVNESYQNIKPELKNIDKSIATVNNHLKDLGKTYPDIRDDPDYQAVSQAARQANGNIEALDQQFRQLTTGLNAFSAHMNEANRGFAKVIAGQKALTNGLQKLVDGMNSLQKGIETAAAGQGQINSKLPDLENGINGINQGQRQLKQGFSPLGDQIGQLTHGLKKSVDGLNKVSGGLDSAHDYLNELSKSNSSLSGFYIPDEALENKQFKNALDAYMSVDRKVTTMDVIFKENPYSTEALNQIDDIKAAVKRITDGTKLENAKVGIGGVTSTYADLRSISKDDYSRTMILMLIGIGLILVALFRSFIMPLYVIASLVLMYYTSMGIAETVFEDIMGFSGISWAVPFFAFVMLIALGVDYSIFLMDRFNEYRDIPVKDAMLESMRNMGTVIISAAVILGGTFAAMLPSGVMSLIEIATIIIIGLVLYALLMLPLFTPVMVRIFGKANWWPFKRHEH
ncbi:RND superfamily putative drug exporter [Scopulibacillus darangshiensis]|uniref:RND superfamily putative drug exporter n=1 Tax=Scopulibacillus darangshiensis TaxID=442528 RepID=A0A4R2P6N4_9BACL|nr:MMPL family transporter [Scopulibacillus darangshiensis]TCP30559.1 RND superfamily putative drug exporter [Scopulibacillus darangshiensis]